MLRIISNGLAALLILCSPSVALAQGGGASTTGTIQGRVVDASGAVLPGVTVTASSPSMIGIQTQTTNENGTYRIHAVALSAASLNLDLSGFRTGQPAWYK